MVSYQLTHSILQGLKQEHIPDNIIHDLEKLQNQQFVSEKDFSNALQNNIEKKFAEQYGEIIRQYAGIRCTVDYLLGRNGNHDTIVPIESQRGGLITGQFTPIRGIVHAFSWKNLVGGSIAYDADDSETISIAVFHRIRELLFQEPPNSPAFGFFTAFYGNDYDNYEESDLQYDLDKYRCR